MKWYKMYVNSIRDVKFRKLNRKYPADFPFIWMLWSMMLDEMATSGGRLEYENEEDLLDIFDVLPASVEIPDLIHLLSEADLITDNGSVISVKNWEKYQVTDNSAERVRKHRTDKKVEEQVTKIINQFNEITGGRFSVKTEGTRELIRGRLKEGRTEEELMAVTKWKLKDWGNDPKMNKFVRPSTLFRPGNFDNYLNEIPAGEVGTMSNGFRVRDMYGAIRTITQDEFAAAESGFYKRL